MNNVIQFKPKPDKLETERQVQAVAQEIRSWCIWLQRYADNEELIQTFRYILDAKNDLEQKVEKYNK